MVLHTMRWPDEIRRADFGFLDEDVAVRPQELQMAEALIASMTGEFDPTEFKDNYRQALEELLEAKASGGEVQPVPEVADTGAAVVDLMSALRRSVERARGGASADDEPAPRKTAAKKTTAKKAPAKKAAAEAPAKKTTAKKAAAPAKKATAAKTTAKKAPAKRRTA
jgi:DNA end-binding protein Ku